MKKASLLRQSAQKYATGNIKKGDYIVYRKELLDAIEKGEPQPEIPKEWMRYKGSATNPELQTLMTTYHDMQEETVTKPGLEKWQKIAIVALVGVIVLGLSLFLISNKAAITPNKTFTPIETISKTNKSTNPFIKDSLKLISKKKWQLEGVNQVSKDWQAFSKMEKTAIKRNSIYKQLKSQAIDKLLEYDETSEEYKKIKALIDSLN